MFQYFIRFPSRLEISLNVNNFKTQENTPTLVQGNSINIRNSTVLDWLKHFLVWIVSLITIISISEADKLRLSNKFKFNV